MLFMIHIIQLLLSLLFFTHLLPLSESGRSSKYKGYGGNFHARLHTARTKSFVGSEQSLDVNLTRIAEVRRGSIIRASSLPHRNYTKKQVIYLHFHKAGGTSICHYFKKSKWRIPEKYCICNEKATTRALFAHTRRVIRIRSLDKMFHYSDADICMFEKKWVQPQYFFQLRQIFNGAIATTLRHPWDRFRSNYEKDYSICRETHSAMTIKEYSKLTPRDCIKSYYLRTNTNRPNFYVRMLNGLSIEQYSFVGDGDGELKVITAHHLEQAKEVLLAFDVILFLEETPNSRNMKLQELTGSSLNLTQQSNNPFSEVHKQTDNITKAMLKVKMGVMLERDMLPPTDFYRSQFEAENDFDMKLYAWAYEKFANKRSSTTFAAVKK